VSPSKTAKHGLFFLFYYLLLSLLVARRSFQAIVGYGLTPELQIFTQLSKGKSRLPSVYTICLFVLSFGCDPNKI